MYIDNPSFIYKPNIIFFLYIWQCLSLRNKQYSENQLTAKTNSMNSTKYNLFQNKKLSKVVAKSDVLVLAQMVIPKKI
jgi:hypothetical protein